GTGGIVFGAGYGGFGFCLASTVETPPGGETGGPAIRGGITAITFHSRKEGDGEEAEDEIAGPHADGGRKGALTRESGADNEEKIVGADDDDGEERASGATSATWLRAKGNSNESEDETGDGKGKALVE